MQQIENAQQWSLQNEAAVRSEPVASFGIFSCRGDLLRPTTGRFLSHIATKAYYPNRFTVPHQPEYDCKSIRDTVTC